MKLRFFTTSKIQLLALGLMIFVTQLHTQPSFAVGGGMVGNGAGLVENTFVFAYRMLPQLIESCINTENCVAADASTSPTPESIVLRNIAAILKQNLDGKALTNHLQFVSETENPGFFTTGDHEPNRIAKTCLNSSCPIYINLDLLYVDGKPALNYSTITGILIHELGHQTGHPDHVFLDSLGAKIRIFADARFSNYIYPFDACHIEFRQFNYDFPMKYGELYLSKTGQSKRVTQHLLTFIRSVQGWYGFEFVNGHYLFSEQTNEIHFEVWAKVYVQNVTDQSTEVKFLHFDIQTDSTGDVLSVNLISK